MERVDGQVWSRESGVRSRPGYVDRFDHLRTIYLSLLSVCTATRRGLYPPKPHLEAIASEGTRNRNAKYDGERGPCHAPRLHDCNDSPPL